MRMVLGFVGLLVTLAIVAVIAKGQLKPVVAAAPVAASATAGTEPVATRDLPRKVQEDLTRAMQQAPSRDDESR